MKDSTQQNRYEIRICLGEVNHGHLLDLKVCLALKSFISVVNRRELSATRHSQ